MPKHPFSSGDNIYNISKLTIRVNQASTAVPLFIFAPFTPWAYDMTGASAMPWAGPVPKNIAPVNPRGDKDGSSRFNVDTLPSRLLFFTASSWLDYVYYVAPFIEHGRRALKNSISISENGSLNFNTFQENLTTYNSMLRQMGYFAMRLYFINGGGPCHIAIRLVATPTEPTFAAYSELPDYIARHKDITLFCPLTGKSDVDSALIDTATQDPESRLFCLTTARLENNTPSVVMPLRPLQTAAYFPWVRMETSSLECLTLRDLQCIFKPAAEPDILAAVHVARLSEAQKRVFNRTFTALLSQPQDIVMSPVPAIAGVYCRNDNIRGVWKAPSNVTLNGISGVCDQYSNPVIITPALKDALMKNNVNALTVVADDVYRIWGARTLGEHLSQRCYISVQRLFSSIETDIKDAMRSAIFAPNTPNTWDIVRTAIDHYLHSLWQRGALVGNNPEEAYFVKMGLNITMNETDIANGIMIVRVGLAALNPAGFTTLTFSQKQR